MSFVARTKDNPGDAGRAADQQQSVDNEAALYASLLGPGPVATGGMIRQFIKKTGIADNVATEVATITTTNEAGNTDGGAWFANMKGMIHHVGGAAGENAVSGIDSYFSRAMGAAGAGASSVFSGGSVIATSDGTKTVVSVTFTVVEVSEYVLSLRLTADLGGAAITTASFFGMIDLFYNSFATPPVITSAG